MKKIVILLFSFQFSIIVFAKPKQTVGELLKKADRGAGQKMEQKKQMALPAFSQQPVPVGRAPVDLSQVKPPRTSSFYENANDDRAKLEKITDKQIAELYRLTQKFKNSPQRGELWLRLAELYVEKAGVIEFRKQTEYDQKLKDFQSGKTKVKPRLELADAKEYNKKAIQLYEWFERDFPKDVKIDQALFFLGYNHYEIGNLQKGTDYYTKLSNQHPNSPYVTETHFALAEYYFENEKWKQAQEFYSKILPKKRHRLYGFSLYKIAWCYYRTGRSQDALKTMEFLIRTGQQQVAEAEATGKAINKNRLEGEGLRDIVLFYADAGNPEKAPAYFQSLAPNDYNNYVEKLAYFYSDKGQKDAARSLFRYLISQNPNAPKAFDYKYQIVQLFANANKSREFREELYSWIRDFGTGSSWHQANGQNKELIQNSDKLRESTLRNFTLQQHQTAQNSRAPFSQNLALEGYRLYIAEFQNSPVIGDMHFYFGELLYDMNKFDEAGTRYRWVVENAQNSKYYNKAAENVVLALEREVPKDEAIAKKVGKSLDPVPFDPPVEKFVTASLWYVGKFPNSDKTADIKFRVGRLYYQHNQFDQAITQFRDIVQKYPKTKYAEYSANLLLDIFNLKKDYAGLEKTGSELLAVPSIANSKAGNDIREVLQKATFKKAQDLELAKDFAGSAQQFEAFSKQNPGSPLAASAIFNAAINYERAGMNGSAIGAHVVVLQSKSKDSDQFKKRSRRILGKLYQDAGMLEEAANAYKVAAAELGNDPLAINLIYNTAIIYEALSKNEEAIKHYQIYFDRNKKAERLEALYQMATIYRKQGSISRAIEKYKDYVMMGGSNKEKVVESAHWVYELSRQLRRIKDSDEWKSKVISIQRRYAPDKKGIGATYAAKVRFTDALKIHDEMKAIRIPANPKRQQEAVQNKISLMTKLNKELTEVLKFDSPEEIVGSLSVLGQANLHMAESLIGAPLPAGLNAEEMKQYKAGVEKLAEPFFKKAYDSLKAAVDKGSELDSYGPYYHKARELIVKNDPKIFYDFGEVSTATNLSNWVGQ
jgi:TolA-binding protein